MIATYRPIGNDWPGKRTSFSQRTASRFRRHGRYDGVGDQQRWVNGASVP